MHWITRLAVGTLAALAGSVAGPAASQGEGYAGDHRTKPSLQQAEEGLLGREHAREHRLIRRADRRAQLRWRRLSPAQRYRERRATGRMAAAGDPATEGRWTAPFTVPVVGVHAAVLPTGKVMLFSQQVHDYRNRAAAAYLWDPTKPGQPGEFKPVPPGDNIWCGAQTLLADGQLLVTGGNLEYATATRGYKGLRSVFTFDPWAETWTRQPDMTAGRWYPTQTLLPDGRTLITSGYDEAGDYEWNRSIDVFNPPAFRGSQGSISTIARYGELRNAPDRPHWYPHWFVMPSGGVLNAGFTPRESWLLDPTRGAVSARDRPDWSMNRKYGSAVLLPGSPAGSTRVMQLGGYDHASPQQASVATSEIFDEARPTAAPAPGPALRVKRSNHNTVLLPDLSMVTIGGGSGEQPGTAAPENANNVQAAAGPEHRAVEILDRGSAAWRLGASQTHKRSYHSTAVLLPDGRVLSAGDDRDPSRGADYRERDKAEIYEPAYLHKPGPRPSIVGAPDGIAFDERFSIDTDTAIGSAVLMAPGTTTHANDMGQRLIPLAITPRADGSGADAVAPPSPNVALPGYHMLFALSPNGKPSVARWVYVGQSRPGVQRQPPPAPVTRPVEPPRRSSSTPRVRLRVATTLPRLRRNGRLPLRISLSEAGAVGVSARLTGGGRRETIRVPRRGFERVKFRRQGTRTVVLKLTRAQRRQIRGAPPRLETTLRVRGRAGGAATRRISTPLRRR